MVPENIFVYLYLSINLKLRYQIISIVLGINHTSTPIKTRAEEPEKQEKQEEATLLKSSGLC